MSYSEGELKPLGGVFKWLRIFFWVYIAGELLIGVGAAMSLSMGSISFGPEFGLTAGDLASGFGGLSLLLGFIPSVIFFCVFSFRAVKNLRILGAKNVLVTPGWAWGWYFIPIANLFKPYGVMDQIWTGTIERENPYAATPGSLPLWWGCWVVSNISSNISFRMSLEAGGFDDYARNVDLYKTSLGIDIFSAVLGITAAWTILKVLKAISEKQDMTISVGAFD